MYAAFEKCFRVVSVIIQMENMEKLENGYIKLYRSILEWKWYQNPIVMRVFVHCLLNASHCDFEGKVVAVDRGCFYTSRRKLSRELGLSEYQVRSALTKLAKTGELIVSPTLRGTHIKIAKWRLFQPFVRKADGWNL